MERGPVPLTLWDILIPKPAVGSMHRGVSWAVSRPRRDTQRRWEGVIQLILKE